MLFPGHSIWKSTDIKSIGLQNSARTTIDVLNICSTHTALKKLSVTNRWAKQTRPDKLRLARPHHDLSHALPRTLRTLTLDLHHTGHVSHLGPEGSLDLHALIDLETLRLPFHLLVRHDPGSGYTIPSLSASLPRSLRHLTVTGCVHCIMGIGHELRPAARPPSLQLAPAYPVPGTEETLEPASLLARGKGNFMAVYRCRSAVLEFLEALCAATPDYFRQFDTVSYICRIEKPDVGRMKYDCYRGCEVCYYHFGREYLTPYVDMAELGPRFQDIQEEFGRKEVRFSAGEEILGS